ncbi:VirB8/TrbF family protein (plasmid) [Synechocystis sp. B12]|nr:VirB8/TrbF family protein [Synechocystis sp. B12]
MERYGSYIADRDNWRRTALVSLAITVLAVVGMVYSASQNHFIPYVVAVDRLGNSVAAGRADVASRADARIVRAQLARWVTNTRSVYVDAAAQRSVIDEAYAMISRSGSSYNVLNQHFRSGSPFERAERETVTVEVKTVLPIGGDTWQVEWVETTRGRNGEVQRTDEWQAAVTVVISPPTDEITILRNPLGVYITEFSWTKRA